MQKNVINQNNIPVYAFMFQGVSVVLTLSGGEDLVRVAAVVYGTLLDQRIETNNSFWNAFNNSLEERVSYAHI